MMSEQHRKSSKQQVEQQAEPQKDFRFYLAVGFVLLLTAAMTARLGYLQVYDREFLKGQGDARAVRMERINAHRGIIKDRHGKPLAVSTPVLSLWSNPSQTLKAQDLSPLARFLDVQEASLRRQLEARQDKSFVYLRRHLPPADARRLLDQGLPGIHAVREYRRFYPAGEITSHLVGVTDIDDQGQEGLELFFNRPLSGEHGKKRVLKNLHGELIRDSKPIKAARAGRDLHLSIDLRLQYLAYRELKSAVSHFNAEAGSLILLDVQTGRVLAMVNQPSYNPNNRYWLDLAALRNRAITDEFEPGSTVKPFMAMVALQSGKYSHDSIIDTTPGFLKVNSFTIRDPSNRGRLTLSEVLAHSSQVGISKLALGLNEYEVRAFFDRLGFGRVSGVEFPGEGSGYLPTHKRWSDIDRATLAYGYGLTMTPLQLASAYLTIASGGMKRDPTLLLHSQPSNNNRVFSEAVASELRRMLSAAVKEGTGRKAAINGYKVAGKTGTVRKVGKGGGYQDTKHLAFFAGMAPLDNPRLVGVVLIDTPEIEEAGGGGTAAPVFSRVMGGALRILNVVPASRADQPSPATAPSDTQTASRNIHSRNIHSRNIPGRNIHSRNIQKKGADLSAESAEPKKAPTTSASTRSDDKAV